jgi:diguanylate cyclase (GGDEF)-like protein
MAQSFVVIADSHNDDLLFMQNLLQKSEEFAVLTARSGKQTMNYCDEYHIDIFILGTQLPDMQECELCRLIKQHCGARPIQIVVVSYPHIVDFEAVVESGGDDFLVKPFDTAEFQARIKAALIRLNNEKAVRDQQEFYKEAIKGEEHLASRILNQNLSLKQAYQEMIDINRELEKSNRELEKVAKYDYLSGLLNRMNLFNRIDMEIERALRTEDPLCGVMIDIDNFKDINDNYGHQVGDAVIQEIGRRLNQELRKYDHAGRYGGEEFFVVLPNTEKEHAISFGERFRKKLVGRPIDYLGHSITITASFGIAMFKKGETKNEWINRADGAMYMAKETGRNRVATD